MRKILFYDAPLFREHDSGPGHPERPARLEAVRQGVRDSGLEDQLTLVEPPKATEEQLLRVHTAAHVDEVRRTEGSTREFDPDTHAGPRSFAASLAAAGAVVDAVDHVLAGEATRAFCAVRPPGHHAESGRAMGFCLFNNVAVGAAHALSKGAKRVLIVDFDVHHGNGTQEIFYTSKDVLYVSSHAYPFYPGTGAVDEVGEGPGRGFTVNLPLPPGCGDGEYSVLYREVLEPIAESFSPDLVLVSAGFDPHASDPLAGMNVTERGFASVARSCLTAAKGAKGAIFVLEGGYSLPAIAGSTSAVLKELLEVGEGDALPSSEAGRALASRFRAAFRGDWPALA